MAPFLSGFAIPFYLLLFELVLISARSNIPYHCFRLQKSFSPGLIVESHGHFILLPNIPVMY